MDRQILNFTANEQVLTVSNPIRISTNKVSYIEAHFELGDNWQGYDSVRAVWFNDYQTISTVLDSQGTCRVPFEVMKRKGYVKVDLVGSISDGDVLTDRLTTYPVVAVIVDCVAPITGANTQPVTPSQFEQFVASVRSDADRAEAGASASEQSAQDSEQSAGNSLSSAQASEASAIRSANSASDSASSATASAQNAQNASESAQSAENYAQDAEDARDEIRSMSANATTLPAGSDATASYSNGVLSLGIPKGDKGNKGDTGASAGFGTVSASVDATVGTPSVEVTASGSDTAKNFAFAFHNLKGEQGEKGEQGDVNLGQIAELLPTETASGDIVSITDGQAIIPMESLKVALEPIQSGSGTPSPDNVRPISGRMGCEVDVSGKNLNPNGGVNYTTSTSERFFLKAGQYVFSTDNGATIDQNNTIYIQLQDEAGNVITKGGITSSGFILNRSETFYYGGINTPSRAFVLNFDAYMLIGFNNQRPTNFNALQLELGSTATDYEPYQGSTYTNTLPETVYGGTLDVVSGELVVDRAMVTLDGSKNWAKSNTSQETADLGLIRLWTAVSGAGNNRTPNVSNQLPTYTGGSWNVNEQSILRSETLDRIEVAVFTSQYADATAWKNHLASNPLQVVYYLAEPQTIQLSGQEVALLKGTNNVWSDGKVTIVYDADIQRWVAKEKASIQAETDGMIAPTETAYKATRNYTSGSLLIVNGTLYKATANIQSGGTITPNTNVTATTLSEVISALA